MSALLRMLRSPGSLHETYGRAPARYPDDVSFGLEDEIASSSSGYREKRKASALDRGLDWIVHFSGTLGAFLIIQLSLTTWAFLGIPFGGTQIWPIVISNVQAIFSYIFDSFLMRQQLNGYRQGLDIAAELKSRSETNARLFRKLKVQLGEDAATVLSAMDHTAEIEVKLPKEGVVGRCITGASIALGHVLFVTFYWACIFLWLGFGPMHHWSNQWQLDINSATSAFMVFVFSFLAILRERHESFMKAMLDSIYLVDGAVEMKLRYLTNDLTPNPEVEIDRPKVNILQRCINYYADVVGTLVGIALLMAVLITWLALGPSFGFSDNWWLFIGTYAGLMGLNDGFVLRNVQALLGKHEELQRDDVHAHDNLIFTELGLEPIETVETKTRTITDRVSEGVISVCGHEYTVLVGVLFILGLLIGSSAMRWSETGQLLCNVPPSIIESFFMVILITGHNSGERQRRSDMAVLFKRRCKLVAYTDAAINATEKHGKAGA